MQALQSLAERENKGGGLTEEEKEIVAEFGSGANKN